MVIRVGSLLHRFLWSLPIWIPIRMEPARTGDKIGIHVRIYLRKHRG